MDNGIPKRFIKRLFNRPLNHAAIVSRQTIILEQLEGRQLMSITLATVANTDIDDQISEAIAVPVGTTRNSDIGSTGLSGGQVAGQDVDMYKVTVLAGQRTRKGDNPP